MNNQHSTLARIAIFALALLLLSACSPRPPETPPSAAPAPAKSTESAPDSKPARLVGPTFTLIDKLDRPLECVILAKQGPQVLVKRTSDQTRYVIELEQLSPATRQLLGGYPDENTQDVRAFVDARDFAAAKRSVKVEMISATWCGYCTKAKNFFAAQGVTYAIYDHESFSGKERKQAWGTNSLPAVKIGDQIIEGFNESSYTEALLAAYRKQLAAAPRP